ncbi:S28 family serine protease [Streptomyces sp. NPDC005438]|uniref:S28 family serine protease n=1 Tax=Streptomyces sp. NPDC005438 TaxID=3156880 RepID=UPI0033A8058B
MSKALRWLLSLVVLVGAIGVGSVPVGAATADKSGSTDIKDRLLSIKGMSLVEEKPVDGYRFFILNYKQPVDHRHPKAGSFKQRLSILHKDVNRPNVFFTSGYGLNEEPRRSEPTQMIDGNQVSMEYRFFTPSRPEPADWSKLDIWQAASDQHRLFKALNKVYNKRWISTGGSKGGMTATYYRRHYPRDMDGTVAYVAPNDVDNDEDSRYDEFFENVGTKECRDALTTVTREALSRRDTLVPMYKKWAKEEGYTFKLIGNADKAWEIVVLDLAWGFWQYHLEEECADVPAKDVSDKDLYEYVDTISGLDAGTDQGMEYYTPYYYQAGTELGAPTLVHDDVKDLLKYPGLGSPRLFVPRDIPMKFKPKAMRDIDRWVKHRSRQMMFVNGENDPWGAEPFEVGKGSKDSHVFVAPGQNHGAGIATLDSDDRVAATRALMKWADVDVSSRADGSAPKRLTSYNAKLDQPDKKERMLRP